MHRSFPVLIVLIGTLVCSGLPVYSQGGADESPLLTEPTSIEGLFDAAVLMMDLDRPGLARKYLTQMMDQGPDDADILKMRDKHGPAVFLEMANDRRLQPLSVELLTTMNDAFRRFANDPNRIDRLIADLEGTPQKRAIALAQLRNAGAGAVPRMLQLLDTDAVSRDSVVFALTRMGRGVVPALLGALDAPSPKASTAAVDALGFLRSDDSIPWLWYPAFGPTSNAGLQRAARSSLARILQNDANRVDEVSNYDAISQLQKIALTHLRNEFDWPVDDEGLVAYWAWSPASNILQAWRVAPRTASLLTAIRMGRQALAMSPERRDLQSLYLSIRFAWDVEQAGWENPLPTGEGTAHDLALLAGPDVSLDVLKSSLQHPVPSSAYAALQVLAQIGNRRQLAMRDSEASPIIQSLNHPDPRVQFAAAQTVLQLDPDTPFRGSTRVVSILMRALNDSGERRALAIDPSESRAATTAAQLGELSYDPLIAATGQEGFRLASERGDVSLIVIHAACIRWGLDQTLANLRADSRTAGIPIVIYAPRSIHGDLLHVLDQYSLTGFAEEGEELFKVGVRKFLARLETPALTDTQRSARIESAGFWFAHIADGHRTEIFDITDAENTLFEAVNLPEVGVNGILALAAITTGTAQQRLYEVAASEGRDEGLREVAALQLAFHIQKHGLLLTKEQVLATQVALQNATSPAMSSSLATVVGSFRPTRSRVAELLQSLPDPVIPETP
jgi:hypothetical protein